MSGTPFFTVLFAFMASAVPVFSAAILLSLTVAGRELPGNSAEPIGNSGPSSNHAKSAKPPPIEPDRALLASLLEAADTDPVASVPDQPEPVLNTDAGDETRTGVDAPHLALGSEPPPPPQNRTTEETKTIPPAEAIGDTLEDNVASVPRRPRAAAQTHANAEEPKSLPGRKQSGAYVAGVYAALARQKPIATARGSATVNFAIGASGALSDVRLRQSSGNVQLDRAALQTVRDAAPFSPPPHGPSAYTIRIDF